MPGNASAAVIWGNIVLDMTAVIVRVVPPTVPVAATMTRQFASCVAVPAAAPHGPAAVSSAPPVSLTSSGPPSLRILTEKAPYAPPSPGRLEVGGPRSAPRAHVAPARWSFHVSGSDASTWYAYSRPASAT